MRYLMICLTLTLSLGGIAQENTSSKENVNPRVENRFGVNLIGLGPTIGASLSIDYFASPSINIEAGAGAWGYFGGVKYHINGNKSIKSWTPYIGINAISVVNGVDILENILEEDVTDIGVYLPVGLQYLSDGGFTFGIELAGLFVDNYDTYVWGAVKLGYHF